MPGAVSLEGRGPGCYSGPMGLEIINRQRKIPVDRRRLAAGVTRALAALGMDNLESVELCIVLAGDLAIAKLHGEHFGDPTPTNVISFPARRRTPARPGKGPLGDIVISAETAARDAAEAGQPADHELLFLAIHGLLHLIGHDHVKPGAKGRAQRQRMEREERRLLKAAWGRGR